jgi:hypothetical protein
MRLPVQIDLLASEAVANKILDAERLKSAELRLELIEREGKHMCLAPACRMPVVGKYIFEHCSSHLSPLEKRWLEEDIESPNWKRPADDPSEHPLVKAARLVGEEREKQISKDIVERKEKAIVEARELIEHSRRLDVERSSFLPAKLRLRISKAYEALMEDCAEAPRGR